MIGATEACRIWRWADASLSQKRRERIKAVSDEALIDVDDYTMMLAAKRKRTSPRAGCYPPANLIPNQETVPPSTITMLQNVNRVCNSSRRLFALSVKIPPPTPLNGWFALPNSGDVISPVIAPGLL